MMVMIMILQLDKSAGDRFSLIQFNWCDFLIRVFKTMSTLEIQPQS